MLPAWTLGQPLVAIYYVASCACCDWAGGLFHLKWLIANSERIDPIERVEPPRKPQATTQCAKIRPGKRQRSLLTPAELIDAFF